jgi:4-diphosphocytidyl-2-C-methyl-D-erythritol kinase
MIPTVTRSAFAKVNLALAVAPPRTSDGLHPICSWFAPIALADDLRVTRLGPGAPSTYAIRWAPDAPRPTAIDWPRDTDLAARAHRLLESETGRSLPISMTLAKRIPVGGGLGGGSSDAAAMLRAIIDLFSLDVPATRLRSLAFSLGSDVPYFLTQPLTPAIVEGVGESITPTPPITGSLLLIFPPFGCTTGAVYRAFDAGPQCDFRADEVRRLATEARPGVADLFNDLALPAETVEPRLGDLRRRAARILDTPVHVTGSGSTLFAPVRDADARAGFDGLAAALPGCSVTITRFPAG